MRRHMQYELANPCGTLGEWMVRVAKGQKCHTIDFDEKIASYPTVVLGIGRRLHRSLTGPASSLPVTQHIRPQDIRSVQALDQWIARNDNLQVGSLHFLGLDFTQAMG